MWDGAGGASRAGWERPGAPARGGTAAGTAPALARSDPGRAAPGPRPRSASRVPALPPGCPARGRPKGAPAQGSGHSLRFLRRVVCAAPGSDPRLMMSCLPLGFLPWRRVLGPDRPGGSLGGVFAERVVHSFINWAHANGALPSAWCARSTDLARTRGGEAEVRMGRWLSCCARTPRRREETVRAGQGVLSREVASSLMAP